MHVLTKIFIVLVSLMAILLVPLVVVYAHNEDSYKEKYEEASASAAISQAALASAQNTYSVQLGQLQADAQQLQTENENLRADLLRQETDVRQMETELNATRSSQANIEQELAKLSTAVQAGEAITEDLIDEVRSWRSQALKSEGQVVELNDALRDVSAQLDVAIAARRALQEELERLNTSHAKVLDEVSQYVASYGPIAGASATTAFDGKAPTKNLTATIINIQRSPDQVLAEINAGSRDGIEEGWVMTIGHAGTFIGKLRIIEVDINRATGVVTLENPNQRGRVEVGHRAYARAGHN